MRINLFTEMAIESLKMLLVIASVAAPLVLALQSYQPCRKKSYILVMSVCCSLGLVVTSSARHIGNVYSNIFGLIQGQVLHHAFGETLKT